jgi:hypothetical protein
VTAPRGGARSPGVSGGARGAIVIGLAVILGIVGLQIIDDSGDGSSSTTTVSTVPGDTTGTTGATGSSATTKPLKPNNQVRVKVYNASGVQGKAQTLTDTLRAAGYNMQAPDNLGTQRQGTVVECTSAFTSEGALIATFGIPGGATPQSYPSKPPAGASDADCLVIIGS